MPIKPTLTPPPVTKPSKFGNDPVAFDAAMQADLDWIHDHWHPDQLAAINYFEGINLLLEAAFRAGLENAEANALTATSKAAAAAASAIAAAAYASAAQATNPDSPIRQNPRQITANFTVAAAYNAQSTGPITIQEGVTVTISDNATYAIQ